MEDIGRGSGGLPDTKHSPLQLTVPTEAEETTRWSETQRIQRDGTSGCKIVLNGQMALTLPSAEQHRFCNGACLQ